MQAPVDQDLALQQAVPPAKMLVPQLKEQLKTFNMPVSGKKADLVHRLETALAAAAASGHASDAASPVTNPASASGKSATEPEAATSRVAEDESMSPSQTFGSHATVSQISMTSLEVAALSSEEGGREPGGAAGVDSEAEEHQGVAGVKPGTQGLGDVATFEVRIFVACVCWSCMALYKNANVEHMRLLAVLYGALSPHDRLQKAVLGFLHCRMLLKRKLLLERGAMLSMSLSKMT